MGFVHLDGLSLKVLRDGEGIVRETVYVALGITPDGEKRILGELWQRGLQRRVDHLQKSLWARVALQALPFPLGPDLAQLLTYT